MKKIFLIPLLLSTTISFACKMNAFSRNLASVLGDHEPKACSIILDTYFDYLDGVHQSYSETKSDSSFRYFSHQNNISVKKVGNEYIPDNRDGKKELNVPFAKAMNLLHTKFPHITSKYCPDLIPGQYKADLNFFGEPDINLCAILAARYNTLDEIKVSEKEITNALYTFILARAVVKPNGILDTLKSRINNSCVIANAQNKTVSLYDIVVHKTLTETYNNLPNAVMEKFDNHQPLKPKIVEVACDKALNLIDLQRRHWMSVLTSTDAMASSSSSSKKSGTYSYVEVHPVDAFKPFKQLVQYSSLVLSKDGYIDQNISAYKSTCLDVNKKMAISSDLDDGQIDEVIADRKSTITKIKSIMTDRRNKDFKNYKPDTLIQPSSNALTSR